MYCYTCSDANVGNIWQKAVLCELFFAKVIFKERIQKKIISEKLDNRYCNVVSSPPETKPMI